MLVMVDRIIDECVYCHKIVWLEEPGVGQDAAHPGLYAHRECIEVNS
jgi:hypothetical protein